MLLDIRNISVVEVTGRLRAVEQWRNPQPVHDNHSRLLLREEEWLASLKIREAAGKGGGGSSGNGGGNSSSSTCGKKRSGQARVKGKGKADGPTHEGEKPNPAKDPCGKMKGHSVKECMEFFLYIYFYRFASHQMLEF
jgi:hypothetical protein